MKKSSHNKQSEQSAPPPNSYCPAQNYYPPQNKDEDIDLLDLWRVLWCNKLLVILITIFFTVVAIAYALNVTPTYRAEVLMAPVTEEKSNQFSNLLSQFGGLAAFAGINFNSGGSKDEAIAFLKSRALTVKFIREENLLPVLFDEKWDAKKNSWNVNNKKKIPTMWHAYRVFNKNVRKVLEDRKTGLVTLAIEWKDPKLAASWAAKMVQRVNANMRERAVQETENNLKYLRTALTKTSSVEVQEAIYRIIESQIKSGMLAKSRIEYAFKIIDPPVVPEQRIRPKRKKIVIIGFALGLFCGTLIALGRNYVRRSSSKIAAP